MAKGRGYGWQLSGSQELSSCSVSFAGLGDRQQRDRQRHWDWFGFLKPQSVPTSEILSLTRPYILRVHLVNLPSLPASDYVTA